MIDMSEDETSENNILYELLIHAEWPQEPEIQGRGTAERLEEKYNPGNSWSWLGPFAPTVCPPVMVQKLTNLHMPWQFAVGGDGRVVAVLQDQSLEIRSSRDEYGSIIGRIIVAQDSYPQWRKMVWSPDCTMLAVGYSNGSVDVYDLIGAHLFTIPSKKQNEKNLNQDFSVAVAGMFFSDVRVKNTQWSYEFLVVNYKGKIKGYFVSLADGYHYSHSFSFASYYPIGISAFCYHQASHLLLLSGRSQNLPNSDSQDNASGVGISAWRILSGHPHYKLALSLEDEMSVRKNNWWQMFPLYSQYGTTSQDIVYKMSISPNEDILAAIHTSGALSLWNLPSLRLKKFWDLQLQPNYADVSPHFCELGKKRKASSIVSDPLHSHLIDVNWWSNEAVILVRYCGAVTVSSVHSLKNLLGISPEWFEPSAQVSLFCDRGFLAMECESYITTKKRLASEVPENADGEESSDDEEVSIFTYTAEMTKRALYFVTDSERFQPPRKKMKFLNKTYRLLCLKSTTPEELYTRKINNEEYGEALALAKTYNLDCDLVYQRQWRKMPASVATIQDYLSKITKRSWVLHECIERVPETIEAAKELLMYGLRGTDLTALIAIGKGEDHGRFIVSEPLDEEFEEMQDAYSLTIEEVGRRKKAVDKKRAEMLKKVDFSRLSLEQKQLCQCRLKLLTYLDRLTTYEIVLGGPLVAEELYDHNFFKQFRLQSGLEASIGFAHNSNWRAVAAMFTYHGSETLPHRLAILNNFPETTSPIEYQSLLPKLSYKKDSPIASQWNEDTWRDPDWCENKYQRSIASPVSQDFVVDFYDEHKELLKYRHKLTGKLLTEWFLERAREIESRSSLVDNALDLVKLGMERYIQGLEKLFDDLVTLGTLVYDCLLDKDFSLKQLEEISDFEKTQLLMSTGNEDSFIKNVKQWLLPFLDRCEKHEPGSRKNLLKRYLTYISKDGLRFCRKIFENSRLDQPNPILSDVEEQMALALDCIYICERTDNLKDACVILEHLPHRDVKNISSRLKKLNDCIDELEQHLRVTELLEKNGTSVTLGFIKDCCKNSEEVKKILTKLTRLAGRRFPVLDETEWRNLLLDILEMQKELFYCVRPQECYEIYLQSLLCCGRQETISFAGQMMECNQKMKKRIMLQQSGFLHYKLPFLSSVNLVQKAAQEYFNSSSNTSDPCMTLAWACLNLIEDVPPSIEEELDLISSLKLLQEFNVNNLPLQVRLCSDRIKLIKQALKNKHKAYKSSQKLMTLAYLLRVCGNNKREREGKVLALVAEAAFNAEDFDPCLNVCKQLMEGGHQEGWSVCYSLGGCKEFSNITARCELMSFALVHCSPDLIETILKSKSELQLQVIYDRVKFLMGDDYIPETPETENSSQEDTKEENINLESNMNALWHTGEKTLQVLQNSTRTTKAVLTSVGSSRFWKDAVKWIQPLELQWRDSLSNDETQNNKDLNMQGICAFYSGLIENGHLSQVETNYERYARPDLNQSMEITSSVLRASLLENTLKVESKKSNLNPSVLLDLAKAYLPEDTNLSLSLLLSLKKSEEAEELFKRLPSTPIVLQFASLFYAIRICALLDIPNVCSGNTEFQPDPAEIIRQVEHHMDSKQFSLEDKDMEVKESFRLLNKYNKMLYDFIQAEILHSIGGGVDAVRFTEDDVYKKETILGIAMTLDDSVFHIAVSLAHHYKLPLWDVYMAHLEYLFADSRTSTAEIEVRIESLKLLKVLLEQPHLFREKLELCVYPNIDGKDHNRLLVYFSLLDLCGNLHDQSGIKPTAHKKLLTKFRAAIKSLDYKLLMKPNTSPLKYLSSLLNESTVHVFAKAALKIPDENGGFLEPRIVYCLWVKKYFFEGSGSNAKIPQTTSEWLHRYDSCSDMLQRLAASDVLEFIECITFTEKALEKLNIECRAEIIKRSLKFCKQKSVKTKDDPDVSSHWNTVAVALQQSRQHLQRMEDEMLVELRTSEDPKVRAYIKELDLSQSLIENLQRLLAKVVIEGPDLSLLKTLLACCPADIEWGPSDAYIEAVNLVINYMKSPESVLISYIKENTPIIVLERILEDISRNKDELMIDDMALEVLHDFCRDVVVPVSTRLSILQLLEKTSCLSEDYSNLLLLYRTQAVVSSTWPDYEVLEDDVIEEYQRRFLFDELVALSTTSNHFSSIAELLCHWPPFKLSSPENEPWGVVLLGLAAHPEGKGLDKALSFLDKAHSMNSLCQKSCWDVFHEISKHGSLLHSLKFAFKTNYEELHNAAISILKQHPELTDNDTDDELLNLALERNLTVHLVPTSLYKPVIEYLLDHQEDKNKGHLSVDIIAKELADAGYSAEAGSLMLLTNGTHTGLSTFSSALGVLHRWLAIPKL